MAKYITLLGNIDGKSNSVTMNLPVASGVTVTQGDFVYFSSGRITSGTIAGARIVGQVQSTATGNSAGTVKALVVVDPAAKYLCQTTGTFTAALVGTYFDLTGATGAQLVNGGAQSATTGQLYCLEYNPQIDPVKSDTTYGVFKIAEHAFNLGI